MCKRSTQLSPARQITHRLAVVRVVLASQDGQPALVALTQVQASEVGDQDVGEQHAHGAADARDPELQASTAAWRV